LLEPALPLRGQGEKIDPGQSQHATLEARWSNWWGSPQLFASVVSAMEDSLSEHGEGRVSSSIQLVSASGRRQVFEGPDRFLSEHAPEHLRGLQKLAAEARSGERVIAFELHQERRRLQASGEAVLRIEAEPVAAQSLTAELAPVATAGYHAFWGPCSPRELAGNAAEQRLYLVRAGLNCLVAAILGAGLYLATARFDVPALAFVALLIGLAVPTVIDRIVPQIEVVLGANTRFRAIMRKLVWAVLSPIGLWFVSLFTG
jgi:hypothetical protein